MTTAEALLVAAALVCAVFVAWSWDGRDSDPSWLAELCAEVACQ